MGSSLPLVKKMADDGTDQYFKGRPMNLIPSLGYATVDNGVESTNRVAKFLHPGTNSANQRLGGEELFAVGFEVVQIDFKGRVASRYDAYLHGSVGTAIAILSRFTVQANTDQSCGRYGYRQFLFVLEN